MSLSRCPWDFLKPGTIQFCEEHLCTWITEPANAWSNIGFVIFGFLILRRGQLQQQNHITWLGLISILIGICSGFFHSTSTLLGQTIDFGSMFLLSMLLVLLNLSRLLQAWTKPFLFWGVIALVLSLVALTLYPATGIPLFGTQFLLAMLLEFIIFKKRKSDFSRRPLFALLGLFAFSLAVWTLDITRLVCWPTNHIFTGHSLWHLLNATAIYCGYLFYRQFNFKLN